MDHVAKPDYLSAHIYVAELPKNNPFKADNASYEDAKLYVESDSPPKIQVGDYECVTFVDCAVRMLSVFNSGETNSPRYRASMRCDLDSELIPALIARPLGVFLIYAATNYNPRYYCGTFGLSDLSPLGSEEVGDAYWSVMLSQRYASIPHWPRTNPEDEQS